VAGREGVTSVLVLTFGGRPRFFGILPSGFGFLELAGPDWRWDDGPAAGGVRPLDDAVDIFR
jgi:hypothetical protein